MATGDKIAAPSPRAQTNERLDLVDFTALSATTQQGLEAAQRALVSSPRAAAGTLVGERWTGSLTANPTSASDGLFRVDSPVFVGLDANSGLVIKPAGVALSVAIPAGGTDQQVYAYMTGVAENPQVRRFIPASTPFTEFPQAVNTALRQSCNLFVRAGSFGSTVPDDVVAGVTTPLLLLGICTNVAGNVTFTPAANTLETVTPPILVPATSVGTTVAETTTTGSQATLRELVNAALYAVGLTMFKGSDSVTPSAGNNWGAYNASLLSGGADKAFRQAVGYFTIGDGVTVIGDFNTNAFARADLLFTAVLAALPGVGGVVIIKRGVNLSNWNGAGFALPGNKTVEIVGDHSDVPASSPQITFAASEFFTASTTGRLSLRNVHVRWVTNAIVCTSAAVLIRDSYFEKSASAVDTGAAIQSVAAIDTDVSNCVFSVNLSVSSSNGMAVRLTGAARRIRLRQLRCISIGNDMGCVQLSDIRDDVMIDDVRYELTGSNTTTPAVVIVNSTDNVTQTMNRIIRRIYSSGTAVTGIQTDSAGWLGISDVDVKSTVLVSVAGFTGAGPISLDRGRGANVIMPGAVPELYVSDCFFFSTLTRVGSFGAAQGKVFFTKCRFIPNAVGNSVLQVLGTTVSIVKVEDCYFENLRQTANDFGAVTVTATVSLRSFIAQGCEFFNFQNVAYAGANSYFRLFEVDALKVVTCIVQECTCTRMMNDFSGSASSGVYLLEMNSSDRVTANASFDQVIVRNNLIGDQEPASPFTNSVAMLVKVSNFSNLEQLHVSRNKLWAVYENGTAGKAALDHLVNVTSSVAANGKELRFDDNSIKVRLGGGSLSAIAIDVLRCTKTGGAGFWHHWMITNNDMVFESATAAFDGVNGFGFNVPAWTINNLTFSGNSAGYGSTGTNYFKFRVTGTVVNFNSTGGAIPASGVALPGIQIARF